MMIFKDSNTFALLKDIKDECLHHKNISNICGITSHRSEFNITNHSSQTKNKTVYINY